MTKHWEWKASKTKTAKEIMLANSGEDYNTVASLIAAATNLSIIEARALYRRVAPDLVANGFVPAVIHRGRPRKTPVVVTDVAADAAAQNDVATITASPVETVEVVERTENGERASIAEMREYLKNMEMPLPPVIETAAEEVAQEVA